MQPNVADQLRLHSAEGQPGATLATASGVTGVAVTSIGLLGTIVFFADVKHRPESISHPSKGPVVHASDYRHDEFRAGGEELPRPRVTCRSQRSGKEVGFGELLSPRIAVGITRDLNEQSVLRSDRCEENRRPELGLREIRERKPD